MSPTPRKAGNYGALGAEDPLGIGALELEFDGEAGSEGYGLVPAAELEEFAFISGALMSAEAAFGELDRCFARNFGPTVSDAPTLLSPALPFMLAESEKEPAAGAVAPLAPGADSLPVVELDMVPRFIESLADGLPAALMSAAAKGAKAAMHSVTVAAAAILDHRLFIFKSPSRERVALQFA